MSHRGSSLASQITFVPSAWDLGSRIEDGEGRHRALSEPSYTMRVGGFPADGR